MIKPISFAGQREDRNNVDKLRLQTNALNFNNQRNIKNSIENLSKDSSTKNINFLMSVAEQIKYGLNAGITDIKPNNDWMGQLRAAAEKGIAGNTDAQESLKARFKQVFENNKGLSDQEKNILGLRESILKTSGLRNEIKTSENENVREIENNLNYFIVSSEVNIDEKEQVLDKINKFMSPKFKVEEQLKDKKPQILGEMLNDIVVKRADQERPTIKQVDQRHHGMCAAISIARKNMAYEYKPQYVDIVMQEVSANPEMEVYDVSKLGTGAKITIPKTKIDYAYAEDKGYRLIDAATLQWMHAAGTSGNGSTQSTEFSAFDREYFDTFHDAHYVRNFEDASLADVNNTLRAYNKANKKASSVKANFEKRQKDAFVQMLTEKQNAQNVAISNRLLAKNLREVMPQADDKTIYTTVSELTHLNTSKYKNEKSPFYIVDAEEDITKKEKISKFIESKYPNVDKEALKTNIDNIYASYVQTTETLAYMNKEIMPKSAKAMMTKYYQPLYEVATTYRTAIEKDLDIKKPYQYMAMNLGLGENATLNDVVGVMLNEVVEELSDLSNLQKQAAGVGLPLDATAEEVLAKTRIDFAKEIENPQMYNQYLEMLQLPEGTSKEELVEIAMKNIANLISQPGPVEIKAMELGLPKNSSVEDVLNVLAEQYAQSIDRVTKLEEHAQRLGLPADATKEDVLKEMERKGEIVPKNILRSLQDRFNKIDKYRVVVEKAEVKGDNKPAVKGLYDISAEEVKALKGVESNLKEIAETVDSEAKNIQKEMALPLLDLYRQIGLEKGSTWVHEGESGLNSPQQIRIFEQMTGKRFYDEENLDDVVKTIKNSDHSGITSSSVYHNDHGWHAMYVADVAPVQIKNKETGKMETKDAIMHDNSWGYAEKGNTWIDSNGLERTDYACGRGGAEGYITNSLWQNGLVVDDIKNKPMIIRNADGSEAYKGRMLTGAILPAGKTLAGNSAALLLDSIISHVARQEDLLKSFEEDIQNGKVSTQDLNSIQLRIKNMGKIYKMHETANNEVWSKIKSEKDWNNLDNENPAKLMMERVAIANSIDSETISNYAKNISNYDGVLKADKMIYAVALKEFVKTLRETNIEDFNLTQYQVENTASGYNRHNIQLVKEWIDKVFDPADNAEFIAQVYKLKAMQGKDLAKLVKENSTKEDLGINRRSSYEMLKEYKNANPEVIKTIDVITNGDAFKETMGIARLSRNIDVNASPIEKYYFLKRNNFNLNFDLALKPYILKNLEYGALPTYPNYGIYNEDSARQAAMDILMRGVRNTLAINNMKQPNKGQEIGAYISDKNISDEIQKAVKITNKMLENNIATTVDRTHRNKALNSLRAFLKEYAKNPTAELKLNLNPGGNKTQLDRLAEEYINNVVRYNITKDPNGIFDEYLERLAKGENSEITNAYRQYLSAIYEKAAAFNLHDEVREAGEKGYAQEVGNALMDLELSINQKALDENGNPKVANDKEVENISSKIVKIGDDDKLVVEIAEETSALTGAETAATIFNTIALSDRIMTSLAKAIDFNHLRKLVQENAQNIMPVIYTIQDKIRFAQSLNLTKSPVAAKAREMFIKQCNNFVKQLTAAV